MKTDVVERLERELRKRRGEIFDLHESEERDLRFISEDREAEFEERAQEEREARVLSRLDDRSRKEIEEIDAALERIRSGTYGSCNACGKPIAVHRLEALPAASLCLACAREQERRPTSAAPEPPPRRGRGESERERVGEEEIERALHGIAGGNGRVPPVAPPSEEE